MKPPVTIKDKHTISAIIGFWRMEVDEATIAAIVEWDLKEVHSIIKLYKSTLE